MEVTAKELRGKPSQIIEQAARGTEIVITIRGKKLAKLIAYNSKAKESNESDEIFGLWKDYENTNEVDHYIRNKRKRREF